jgi:hypothetical protein
MTQFTKENVASERKNKNSFFVLLDNTKIQTNVFDIPHKMRFSEKRNYPKSVLAKRSFYL